MIESIPDGWKVLPLKKLLKIQSGFAFDSKKFSKNKGKQLIRIRDLKNGYTTNVLYDGEYNNDYIVKSGDYLIGMDGDFICYQWKGIDSLLNQRVCKLTSFDNSINPKFIYYGINKHLQKIHDSTSFVTVKHLSVKKINDIEFLVPPLEQQEKIVKVLDISSKLIEKQKELIEKYDLFLKSKFIEMFGDPIRNPMAWEVGFLENIVDKSCPLSYGIVQPGNDYKDGIALVRPVDLENKIIKKEYLKHIDPKISAQYKRTILHGDEILLSVRGTTGTLGKSNLALKGANVSRGIVPVRFNQNYSVDFAYAVFLSDGIQNRIQEKTYGATLKQINLKEVRLLPFIIPPIELQNKFASIAKKVESLKEQEKTKLEQLELLHDSLMSRAFKGEIA